MTVPQDGKPKILFMKHGEGWGLPSVSPGCIQVEAYLRLANISFAVDAMKTSGTSPTGHLPAVEAASGCGGYVKGKSTDIEAAAATIAFLQEEAHNLDRVLSSAGSADCAAFTCLVESKLNDAVLYTTWCEWHGMKHLKAVYGDTLPWPLSYIIPWQQAIDMRKRFKGRNAEEIYGGACQALKALNSRLISTEGSFMLGKHPSSLDAKVYGLLLFIMSSPVVAPVLKDEVEHCSSLKAYVAHIAERFFSAPAPSIKDMDFEGAWSAAAKGQAAGGAAAKHVETEDERRARKRSWYWLGAAGTLMLGYVAFGGQYFDLGVVELDDSPDDEDDD